ncbi:DUF4124 domain-containing protein [Neptunomonas antarctica]|uniref:DUF4124 domain-containing protein n=1 Tax=Neptunomonas antarctica TaxID=619304 RepID=A0A1N7P126_9GAMM|nr:DUF4124 domain-containing protein [Neptunomonas antarctica]SIT04345.1 protein of unknown function [Neptunomonas antarctica]
MSDIQLKIIVLILCMFPVIANAEIYRWTDETGKKHYSDKAPPGVKAEKKEYVNVATPWRKLPKPTRPQEGLRVDETLKDGLSVDGANSNSSGSVEAETGSQGELSTDKKDKKSNKKTKRLKVKEDAENSSSGLVKLDQKDKSSSTPAERIIDIKERNAQAKKDYRTSD